jgi:N-acetylneuraminic acid mutarotase
MKTKSKISAYIIRSAALTIVFLVAIGGLASAFYLSEREASLSWRSARSGSVARPSTQIRALTFVERVAYQHAIEDVYWHHRIWPKERPDPKPSLDAVMPQAQLEKKVADYLRNSQALEEHWQQPITAEQLQTEMDRMAQHTRQPEVLRELFQTLGNDPFVIAECLARPVLSERLVRKFYADDKEPLDSSRARADNQMPKLMAAASANYTLPTISDAPNGCIDDTWTATSTTNAPTARHEHTAVWTGSEMIVWGGSNLNTGGRYNPGTDSWTATSTTNAPTARHGHTAVWTGSEMIVWGGSNLNTGGRYNPITNSWTATSTTNAPTARENHTAVWTGSEMIVWGGDFLFQFESNTGGRYNPGTNSWTATSTTNVPSARSGHTAVWTGSEMIVWGGFTGHVGGYSNTGGRYNPGTNGWTATSTINVPAARAGHTGVWTGSEMIVWGGFNEFNEPSFFNTGGRYNPGTNSWTATSTTNAPSAREGHRGVWTGSEMTVWGGFANFPTQDFNTGGRYNPGTDSWTATSTTNAPTARDTHTAVWTGSEMIVWGGFVLNSDQVLNTGGRYCAQAGPIPTPNRFDFNGDGKTDYVLQNVSTHQTALWYLNNNTFLRGAYGPTLPAGWSLVDVADFNGGGKPDYALFNPTTRQTAIWYMNNNVFVSGAYGPTLPSGWSLVATGVFNNDSKPDYVLYKAATRQTAVWYMDNNVFAAGVFGPTLPAGWSLVGVADFNHDGHTDYALFNSGTGQTAIWYLSGRTLLGGAFGPTVPSGWILVSTADFNGDGNPDYVLYKANTRQTAIWYLNNNVFVSGAYGPTLPAGWSLAAP